MVNRKLKRGQSELITTVLIVLLVLAAIIIVWQVIQGVLKKSSDQVSIDPFVYNGEVKYNNVDDFKSVVVRVFRKSGGGDISGVRILFYMDDGRTYSYENITSLPSEFETKYYVIGYQDLTPFTDSTFNFRNVSKISTYFKIKTSIGDNVLTREIDIVKNPGVKISFNTDLGKCIPKTCVDYSGQCGNNLANGSCSGSISCGCNSGEFCNAKGLCQMNGLVSWWKLDGNMLDSAGGNNGNCINCPNLTSDNRGNLNSAYSFNGSNFINFGNIPLQNDKTISRNMSLSAWVYVRSPAGNSFPNSTKTFVWLGDINNQTLFSIGINYGSEYGMQIGGFGISETRNITNPLGQWHNLIATYEGSPWNSTLRTGKEYYVYVDNKIVYHVMGAAVSVANDFNNTFCYIGLTPGNSYSYFDGNIANVRIYNRVLNSSEVANLYNQGY